MFRATAHRWSTFELAKIKYILLRRTTLLDVKNQRKEQTQEKKILQIAVSKLASNLYPKILANKHVVNQNNCTSNNATTSYVCQWLGKQTRWWKDTGYATNIPGSS